MKYEMRRSDRGIAEEEAVALLKSGEFGVLSLVDANGDPYGVPLSYAFDGEKVFFHGTIEGGRKLEAVEKNNKASFVVVGDTTLLPGKFSTIYHSVIAEGPIKLLDSDEEKRAALMKLVEKYSADFHDKGVKYADASLSKVAIYELTVETLSGKARKK